MTAMMGCGSFGSYREINEEKSFAITGINETQINTQGIPVYIISAETGSEVRCHLHGEAQRGIKLLIEVSGQTVVIKTKYQLNGLSGENVVLDVYIPENFAGNLSIKTTSGIVKADPVVLKNLTINTASGGFDAEKLTAEAITVNTTSGNIIMKELDAKEVNIIGSSADVLINYNRFYNQSIAIKTTSGSITLELPEIAEFSYKIVTASGKFKSDFLMDTSRKASNLNLEGQIGNENNKISLQVTSGDISIVKK